MNYVTLSDGVKMPILGYGVYQVTKDECERCVLDALKVGYRSIDTAQSYFNEDEVGNALVKSGIPREEIFITIYSLVDSIYNKINFFISRLYSSFTINIILIYHYTCQQLVKIGITLNFQTFNI